MKLKELQNELKSLHKMTECLKGIHPQVVNLKKKKFYY